MTSSKMVHVLFVSYNEVIHWVNTCPLQIHVCKFQKHISGARVDLFQKFFRENNNKGLLDEQLLNCNVHVDTVLLLASD